jgi:hypothetical protein
LLLQSWLCKKEGRFAVYTCGANFPELPGNQTGMSDLQSKLEFKVN